MQTEERELVREIDEYNNVASTSDWPSSSLPENAPLVRENVSCSCCNETFHELSGQAICRTETTCICPEGSHENEEKFDTRDPPPSYVEAVEAKYDYKSHLDQVYPLDNINNTRTREVREAEATVSENKRQYKRRLKACQRFTIFAAFLYAFAAVYLIHWQKRISVRISKNEDEALKNVVFAKNLNNPKLYEGDLVHVVGRLSINEPLTDSECGFAITSVKLKRFVYNSEIYMMVKTKNGSTDPLETEPRYYYTRSSGDILLNANEMCVNPRSMFLKRWEIKDQVQTAIKVKIGSLTFSRELKDQFTEYVYVTDKLMELKNDNAVRLMFSYAGKDGDTYTVLGKVEQGVIVPYITAQGDVILSKRMNTFTAEEMIRLQLFQSDFPLYRRSYVISAVIIVLSIAFIYYYKVYPLRPHEDH